MMFKQGKKGIRVFHMIVFGELIKVIKKMEVIIAIFGVCGGKE